MRINNPYYISVTKVLSRSFNIAIDSKDMDKFKEVLSHPPLEMNPFDDARAQRYLDKLTQVKTRGLDLKIDDIIKTLKGRGNRVLIACLIPRQFLNISINHPFIFPTIYPSYHPSIH